MKENINILKREKPLSDNINFVKNIDYKEFNEILKPYLNNEICLKMKEYIAHGRISVYEHAFSVAKMSYELVYQYKDNYNLKALIVSSFLHDLYLYDWHNKSIKVPLFKMHGYTHSFKAAENAYEYFKLDDKSLDMIKSHMWPLTLRTFPNSKEGWILCLADKLVASKETLFKR